MPEPYDLSCSFVMARGHRFHYALEGEQDLPVLALVNMASVNLTHWEPVMAGLLQHFRVLRFDIRGTGKSDWGADEEYTFADYADDLAAIMDGLGIGRAFVLGVAYGARTAAQFALRHESRLSALGLFDVALTPPVEQGGQKELGASARNMLQQAGEEPVIARKSWRFYENREAARKAHTAHESEPDITDLLARLQTPVLVACGRQDINLAQAQRIAAAIPRSSFQILEMTGHGSPLFRPALFVQTVVEFADARLAGTLSAG